jgi:ribosomal protein S18 acetylase RimI-like enzyme
MEAVMSDPYESLFGDYTVRVMADDELFPLYRRHRDEVYADTLSLSLRALHSAEETAAVERLRANLGSLYSLNLGIYHQDEFIGWSFGEQDGPDRFYMVNTGILPAHQGKGIYTRLLPKILHILREAGFQVVWSRHVATNNQVIVPKLKAGFVITGLEVIEMFGVLVHLSYRFNDLRRHAIDFRMGQSRPNDELRKLLALD